MGVSIKTTTDFDGGGRNYYYRMKQPVVDIENSASVDKWAKILGISSTELIEAAKAFGPVIRNIRRGINSKQIFHSDKEDEDKAA